MTDLIFTPVPAYRESAIADGYKFECSCGELYNCWVAASSCRKCRNYCVFGYCTHVVDISTGDVVYGEVPDYDEYQIAAARAEERWAEERAELEEYQRMLDELDAVYDAVAVEKAAERLEEDLWALQDRLMGVRK